VDAIHLIGNGGSFANVFCGFGRLVNRSSLTADTGDSDYNNANGSEGLLHCGMALTRRDDLVGVLVSCIHMPADVMTSADSARATFLCAMFAVITRRAGVTRERTGAGRTKSRSSE
jgi:hypothetical protein